jgi:hypothetical protein
MLLSVLLVSFCMYDMPINLRILLLEDEGIESILLKLGKGLGLRLEYSSRFLCFA